jgi:HD superfamily phosphodiesterase
MKKSYILAGEFFDDVCDISSIRLHSEVVIDICLNSIDGTVLDEDVFIIAGFFHDIARRENFDSHQKFAINYLKKFLEEYPEYKKHYEYIRDAIVHHRRFEHPQTIYGKIFKNAVMMVAYSNRWREYDLRRHMR